MSSMNFAVKLILAVCLLLVAVAKSKSINTIYSYQNYGEEKVVNINGKPFDFETAEVVETKPNYVTYQAKDDPSVKITKYKNGGISIVSTGDAAIKITSGSNVLVTSGNAEEAAKAAKEAVDAAINNMEQTFREMDNVFKNLPFHKPGWPFNHNRTPQPRLPQVEDSTGAVELLD